jgi:hypothetical protein
MKRKISYDQSLALEHGRQTARANQRRRVEASRAAAAAQADRDAQAAEQHERDRELRNGVEVGERVTGRDYFFNQQRAGVVVDGDLHDGVPVLCDDGETRVLYRRSINREEN